ncbi:MAG: sulfatase-like hydrolase/transferase [Pirellulaceae bacterium]
MITPPTLLISLAASDGSNPWCFWYGAVEPHRAYEYGSGVAKGGKKLEQIDKVFSFWPDNETTRNDLLDYAFEIEHFDRHLGKMLELLESKGQLDNTLIVVTADNGMPFPRVKGQEYELSNHLPLAVMWPKKIKKPGRQIDDYVSFIDFAPTFLQAAGIDQESSGMEPITGRSLFDIFESDQSGVVNPSRDYVLIGKERHDVGRPNDWGYPIRGIFKDGMLYLRNFQPDRWPQGNPETGYLNCDGSPTKTEILEKRFLPAAGIFWKLAFGKRPSEEMYNVRLDPECMHNLASDEQFASVKQELQSRMVQELTAQEDPRMLGNGDVFEAYPYADPKVVDFYNRFMKGEQLRAGWVNPTDFQPSKPGDR